MRLRRVIRQRFVPVLFCAMSAVALGVGACAQPAPGPGSGPAPGATSPISGAPNGTATMEPVPPPATEPTAADVEYRVSYNWAVPSNLVEVKHPLVAPIAPPPALPLPYLVGIYVGNHPEGSPAYQRISFYFRGAFPSYRFKYVSSVTMDGSGAPVPLQGNSFLSVVFVEAQAHDNAGASTVKAKPPATIGFKNLKSYGFAGDFEGYVSYGLGIQVAPGSDQILKIRAGELKKPDGAGGYFYVVHFDVQNG